MPSIDLPLSVGGVRALTKSLKVLSRKLRDDIPVDIEQQTCMAIAGDVIRNISGIADVDGNYLGTENPNASVSVEVSLTGHETIWRGKQIRFVEYGTGATGAASPYPGVMGGGYHPDPSKLVWAYKDAKGAPSGRRPHRATTGGGQGVWRVSRGLAPQAPMYSAAMNARATRIHVRTGVKVLREALNEVAIR